MADLKGTTKIVHRILVEEPIARSDDDYLYRLVCETVNPDIIWFGFARVMNNRRELGLPPFETVRRARQKLQATYPELAGNERTSAYRAMEEAEYWEYALNPLEVEG